MAETQTPASEARDAPAATAEAVDIPVEEKREVKDAALLPPLQEAAAAAEEGQKDDKKEAAATQSVSFTEEINGVADVEDLQKKALDDLKQLVLAALANDEFTKASPPPAPQEELENKTPEKAEEPKKEEPVAVASKVAESFPAKEEDKTKEAPAKVEEKKHEAPAGEDEPAVKASKVAESSPADEPVTLVEEKTQAPAKEEKLTAEACKVAEAPAKVEDKTLAAITKEEGARSSPPPEEISLWGVPLLGDDERIDTVLLKFLRARDFKAKEALAMLKDAVIWRKDFGIEGLLEEDLGAPAELAKVVFMQGHGREGHPVCYNVYGEFQDRELYQKVLSDDEKRGKFLRWRVQFLERGIREQLDFTSSGVCSIVQVTDLKNAPGPWKRELHHATKQALALLQDNYPEFVAKQVFINVPWWYLAFNRMISPFLTQRTKSKFVFAGPSKSTETLFKYVAPEQVPIQFGGLSKENDSDFSTSDAVTEVTIKPSTKHAIEIPVPEASVRVWELRVLGWEVSYGAEFVPSAEDGYTVIVQKSRRFASADEPFVKNSFKVGEPGKIVLTVDNSTSKKKKLLYRSKAKNAD